jgi:[ribosomal protein S18]-alanine N-acetyltransferase
MLKSNMAFCEISPASAADHKWCAGMMAASDPWITLKRDVDACLAVLARPGTELFVARDQTVGQLLGFILLGPFGLAGSPYISSIAVAPDARGCGLGAQLMTFAEKRFHDRQHMFLLVSSFNRRAQQFYRRQGYEFIGELKDYIVPGHSELLFHKRLG